MTLEEPRKMLDGTFMSHYNCFRQLAPTLRELGHIGIAINHTCVDRGMAGFERLLEAHCQSTLVATLTDASEGEKIRMHLTTWDLHTSCCCHDTHKS